MEELRNSNRYGGCAFNLMVDEDGNTVSVDVCREDDGTSQWHSVCGR